MQTKISRREVLGMTPAACGVAAVLGLSPTATLGWATEETGAIHDDGFPCQDMEAVEEVVTYSHFHLDRVKSLVTARPELAKASWDWGFGDWESAIGAAAHKGRTDIAKLLMSYGARPTIFAFAMLGDVDVIRAMVKAQPGIQKTLGPHGFTLMYHAKAGGSRAKSVIKLLEEVGEADLVGTDLEIPQDEKRKVIGSYKYGSGPTDRIDVLVERGELRIKRVERVGRRLVRVGPFEYHPSGAPAVRVHFEAIGDVSPVLTIRDARRTIQANRL